MKKTDAIYQKYVDILKRELIPAMGCTEPIALAYAAAKARQTLGCLPERVQVWASGSIIKNINSVIVPNTGHLKGIAAAAAAGIAAGEADRELEVLSGIKKEELSRIREFLDTAEFDIRQAENGKVFDITVTVWKGENYATVRISDYHTNLVLIERNHEILWQKDQDASEDPDNRYTYRMNVQSIWDFADTADLTDVKELLKRQIDCNMAIAEEGLRGDYGANIGKTLLQMDGDNVKTRAKAMAAAASDARMNGCELPVIINSGSGNQGITVSVPVEVYARHLGVTEEKKYQALLLSNLLAIHQKAGIGRLSAYCGAICAGAAAGAGISYLHGGGYREACHTVVNALAVVSGMICDGAKSSCAAKIAVSVEAGIMGYFMYCQGQEFYGGDGIVAKGIENTIRNVGRLGRDGMRETNEEIIRMMIGC